MRLSGWSNVWHDVDLVVATGAARVIPRIAPRPHDAPLSGFAARERSVRGRRLWFAVYLAGEALWFSAGPRRWRLDAPGLGFGHAPLSRLRSRFEVLEGGRCVLAFTYLHPGRGLFAMLDPTYDGIDAESDFFLAFIAQHASSAAWRRSAESRWADAETS